MELGGMNMNCDISPKTLHRLSAADGYLTLEMPAHALAELTAIDDAGPFEPLRSFLEGEALKAQKRYHEAVPPLQKAAETLPVLRSEQAWRSLSECLQKSGRDDLAEVAALTAEAVEDIVNASAFTAEFGSPNPANSLWDFRR